MKVFLFDKYVTEEKSDFIKKLEFKKEHKVKEIIISNPGNSGKLYIIYEIKLVNTNDIYRKIGGISLSSSTSVKNEVCNKNEELVIYIDNAQPREDSMLLKEIEIKDLYEESYIEVLKDNFIIILPGGSFIIRFPNEIQNLNAIVYFEEKDIKG